jgi:hypothetical protein
LIHFRKEQETGKREARHVPDLVLEIPSKRVSAWVAETDARFAREWLQTLPLADSMEAAREVYQALYTLNRLDLEPVRRMELMGLYESPVATVRVSLAAPLRQTSFPLGERKTALSRYARLLIWEMANGYKCALHDLAGARFGFGRKQQFSHLARRAAYYLGETLILSYQVYAAYPPHVWRDLHELYRFAESNGWQEDPGEERPGEPGSGRSLSSLYRAALLLFLARPYQLLQNECLWVEQLLRGWSARVSLSRDIRAVDASGNFLVDLGADAPPSPWRNDLAQMDNLGLRLLDVGELVGEVKTCVTRLNKGESVQALAIGVDCLEAACHDLFKRLARAWGVAARRRHTRLKRRGFVSVCAGLGAAHFFMNDQKPFEAPISPGEKKSAPVRSAGADKEAVTPQTPKPGVARRDEEDTTGPDVARPGQGGDLYRVDRWQIGDIGPRGLLLIRPAESTVHVRVGEVLGIQRVDQLGQWSVAVVRWLKSLDNGGLEMGIEYLAPNARAVAVRAMTPGAKFGPALLLPAMESLKRPATLLVERGTYQPHTDVEVQEGPGGTRHARPLQLLDRTGAFEQVVFGYLAD